MSTPEQNKQSLDSWTTNAQCWDEGIGQDGNRYWQRLQKPCLERLIPAGPAKVLEVSTGNGLVARFLAGRGASVLATDGSPAMVEVAERRLPEELKGKVRFDMLDATKEEDFERILGSEEARDGFDVVIQNMALMDVPTLEPLANALPKLLKKGGIFVATLLHPAFFTNRAVRSVEVYTDKETGRVGTARKVIVETYLDMAPWKGIAHEHQPVTQFYFHRPIHEILGTFFKVGLVVDAVEEPAFGEEDRVSEWVASTSNFTQIPPIFAFRARKL